MVAGLEQQYMFEKIELLKAELNQLYAEQKILFSPSTLTNFVYAKAGKPARSYLSMKKPPKITPSKRQRSKSPAPKAEQQDAHEFLAIVLDDHKTIVA